MLGKAIASILLALPMASAVESAPPLASTATPDFSAGFQRLITLGLPPLEGAEWLIAANANQGMDDYELRELLSEVKGTGWKVQQEGKTVFVPLGGTESTTMPATAGEKGGGSLLGAIFGSGSKKPKAADVQSDANKLIDTIGDTDKSKQFRERLEYQGAASLGRLLLFAAQLQQTGHPAEANRLASILFTLGVTPEAIIDAAVNRIAERDQGRITTAFFATHDWVAYERDLRLLVEHYPRGWEHLPAVQMLLPAVAKRAAKTPAPKPTIEGITLQPEALAALEDALTNSANAPDDGAVERFAKENGIPVAALTPATRQQIARLLSAGGREQAGGAWLIEEPPDASAKDPWSRLKRLGTDALPALAAVVADDSLTESPNSSGASSRSYFGNQESAADKALAAYKSMERPLTRGELACRLLIATVPGENLSDAEPAVLAEAAIRFWKAHRGQSKLDLLLAFLAEGDDSQKSTALSALAEMTDPAATRAFEQNVLENGDAAASLDAVTIHLKTRKAAAKDFFAKFSAALKNQLDGVDLDELRGNGGYEIKNSGGVDKYLKKLSLYVGGESTRKLILELAKAEKPDKQQIASLAETAAASSKEEFMSAFLEAAVSATNLETRSELITAIRQQANQNKDDSNEKDTPVPPNEIPQWAKLLADERKDSDGETMQSMVAAAIESIYSPGSMAQLEEIYPVDPIAYEELPVARAKERLAGKALTPLPDAEKVPPARLEELLKLIGSAKAGAVNDLIQTWTIDEKLAFQNWRSDEENQEKFPKSLIAARRLITAPHITPATPADPAELAILESLELRPGTKIDADLLISIAAKLAPQAKERSGLSIGLTSSTLDTGYMPDARLAFGNTTAKPDYLTTSRLNMASSIMRKAAGESEEGSSTEDKSVSDGLTAIVWHNNYGQEEATWALKSGTVTPPSAKVLEKFREAVASLDQPSEEPPAFFIVVLHRDDLEKLPKLRLNEDDEEQ